MTPILVAYVEHSLSCRLAKRAGESGEADAEQSSEGQRTKRTQWLTSFSSTKNRNEYLNSKQGRAEFADEE